MNNTLENEFSQLQKLHSSLLNLLQENPTWAQEQAQMLEICSQALTLASRGLSQLAEQQYTKTMTERGCAIRNGIFLNIPGRWLTYESDKYPKVANTY